MSEEFSDDVLALAFKAIETKDFKMPFELWPSGITSFSSSNDPWDKYESDKFDQEWPESVNFWNKVLARARRILKLEKIRKYNSSYCTKQKKNIR